MECECKSKRKLFILGVYEEDVIQSKDKKHLGIVVKAYQNDDSDEYSSDEEDEEEEEEKLTEGKVMIGWYSTNPRWKNKDTEVLDENKVGYYFNYLSFLHALL